MKIPAYITVTTVVPSWHVRKLSSGNPLHSLGYRWQVVERNTAEDGTCRLGDEETGKYAATRGGAMTLAREAEARFRGIE